MLWALQKEAISGPSDAAEAGMHDESFFLLQVMKVKAVKSRIIVFLIIGFVNELIQIFFSVSVSVILFFRFSSL